MRWLLPLKDVLIEVWSPRFFGTYESKDGAFKVDVITTAITSKWLWAFVLPRQILSSVLVGMGSWAEDCPCHDKRMRAPDRTSVNVRRQLFVDPHRGLWGARLFCDLVCFRSFLLVCALVAAAGFCCLPTFLILGF